MNRDQRPTIDEATHLFRRQYLLGPKTFTPNSNWSTHSIADDLHLSVHGDLPVVTSQRTNGTLALVGTVVDPFQPSATAEELLAQAELPDHLDAKYLDETTKKWSGRWCLFCVTDNQRIAIGDACCLRAMHYFNDGKNVWCGSQPEIIRTQVDLSPDQEVVAYYKTVTDAGIEPSLIGYRTEYENCFAVLPNYYLDLSSGKVERFYPREALTPIDTKEALDISTQVLRGGLEGLLKYGKRLSIPVTAGYESRALLAASKPFQSECDYFVDRKGVLSDEDGDVYVPKRVCAAVNVPFTVENSIVPPDDEFVKMFLHNVTGARNIPKTNMIYRKFLEDDQRININGNGSEVCRFLYDPYRRRVKQEMDPVLVLKVMNGMYSPIEQVNVDQTRKWLEDIKDAESKGYLCLDLAYWEQRMGRWGSLYPAEQDIVIDEFSPFDNRYLIETLLRVAPHLRCAPKYTFYRMIMKELWPEVLGQPFNPMPFKKAMFDWACKRLPDPVQKVLVHASRSIRMILGR